MMTTKDDVLIRIEAEAGIIATLFHNPEYSFYSEHLLPNHFTNMRYRILYTAITDLAKRDIATIDPYNIYEDLNSKDATRHYLNEITIEEIYELMDMSNTLRRNTVEEYRLLVENVLDAAFRRDMLATLESAKGLCAKPGADNIEQMIYDAVDSVMAQYSAAGEVPVYKDVIDQCWQEIQERQKDGFAGIPFKFPSLNEYATIEPGELFLFAAEAKQGKSMILLNCAVDLLKQDLSVLYLDSELNTRMFTARILAHLTGIEYRRLTTGNYSEEEAKKIDEAVAWLKTRKFVHTYIPTFDMQSIYTTVKKIYHTQGLDVLIVDYFKSSGEEPDAFGTYQELGRFVDTVKNKICGDMGICGLGAVQATSTGRIADSAKIGRNASTIAMIQDKTPEEIEEDGVECGNKKLRVVLNRNGMQMAPGEYISLFFDGNHILYREAVQAAPHIPY